MDLPTAITVMAIFAAKGESDMGIGESFNEEDSLSDDPSATAELERNVALQCQQIEELQRMLKRKPCTFYFSCMALCFACL